MEEVIKEVRSIIRLEPGTFNFERVYGRG